MSPLFHIDPPTAADPGSESDIQTRFRSRMRILAPEVRLVAMPNAGKRTAWEAQQRKREGLAKGWPDLGAHWCHGFGRSPVPHVAWLEFKDRKGSLSIEQHDNLNWLTQAGFPCGVFRSVETAIEFLRQQGAPFLFHREVAA